MPTVTLTDRYIASPARVPKAGMVEYKDSERRGLLLRVSWTGYRGFLLLGRFPPATNPTRRAIGPWPEVTLEEARETALQWRRLIRAGKDPAREEKASQDAARAAAEAAKAEEVRVKGTAFNAVAEVYITKHVNTLAQPMEVASMVRFLAGQIGATPIAEVTSEACESAILAAKLRAAARQGSTDGSGAARRYFQVLQHLFTWARKTPAYKQQGLLTNPMGDLDSAQTAGKATRRQRTLDDAELAAVWQAASQTPYPYGPLIKLLVLTGCRRDELSEMRWPEIDLSKKLITIPAARMKMDLAHTIPLAPMAFEVLATLQRGSFDCVFSANEGRTPFRGFHRSKQKLDQLSGVSGFAIHDIRRSFRSRLSALKIEEVVREAMIAHMPAGLKGTYDTYRYDDEKRAGYEKYEAALSQVLLPKQAVA